MRIITKVGNNSGFYITPKPCSDYLGDFRNLRKKGHMRTGVSAQSRDAAIFADMLVEGTQEYIIYIYIYRDPL